MAAEMNYAGFGDSSMLQGDLVGQAEQIAEKYLPADQGTAEGTTQEAPPVESAPAQEPAVQPPSQGQVLEVPEDTLVRVKIDGEVKEVPYKEFKDSLQREAAWHQRQQQFATTRKQLEEYYAQQFAALEQQAQQVAMYEQWLRAQGLQQAQPQQQTQQSPAQGTPDEIATLGEVQREVEKVNQQIAQALAAREHQLAEQLQRVAVQLKSEMQTKQEAARFDAGLKGVLQDPTRKFLETVIPKYEQNLRYAVWELGPQSVDEAVEFADKISAEWAKNLRSIQIAEQQKEQAQKARAKLEPSDGSPPAPQKVGQKRSFIGKDGKLDHAALREAAMSLLD